MTELLKLGEQCSVKLDAQDESKSTGKKNKSKGRPMSDSGTKARFYHAVKDAHMAHLTSSTPFCQNLGFFTLACQ